MSHPLIRNLNSGSKMNKINFLNAFTLSISTYNSISDIVTAENRESLNEDGNFQKKILSFFKSFSNKETKNREKQIELEMLKKDINPSSEEKDKLLPVGEKYVEYQQNCKKIKTASFLKPFNKFRLKERGISSSLKDSKNSKDAFLLENLCENPINSKNIEFQDHSSKLISYQMKLEEAKILFQNLKKTIIKTNTFTTDIKYDIMNIVFKLKKIEFSLEVIEQKIYFISKKQGLFEKKQKKFETIFDYLDKEFNLLQYLSEGLNKMCIGIFDYVNNVKIFSFCRKKSLDSFKIFQIEWSLKDYFATIQDNEDLNYDISSFRDLTEEYSEKINILFSEMDEKYTSESILFCDSKEHENFLQKTMQSLNYQKSIINDLEQIYYKNYYTPNFLLNSLEILHLFVNGLEFLINEYERVFRSYLAKSDSFIKNDPPAKFLKKLQCVIENQMKELKNYTLRIKSYKFEISLCIEQYKNLEDLDILHAKNLEYDLAVYTEYLEDLHFDKNNFLLEKKINVKKYAKFVFYLDIIEQNYPQELNKYSEYFNNFKIALNKYMHILEDHRTRQLEYIKIFPHKQHLFDENALYDRLSQLKTFSDKTIKFLESIEFPIKDLEKEFKLYVQKINLFLVEKELFDRDFVAEDI